jgi:3-dehydroquinate synthase
MTAVIPVPVAPPYEVHVGPGLLAGLGKALRAVDLSGRVVLLSDANVLARWGAMARRSLAEAGLDGVVVEVLPGEGSKTLVTAGRIYGTLIEAGLSRGDAIVALGGGVVGDLAGFVAATYHRGVPFVQAPTTLLAQVDAAIGGKVGVDHPLGKNLIGAFHQPRLVLADTFTLSTLPARERWNGLAEVAKAALIADPELFEALEEGLETAGEGTAPPAWLAAVIERAVRIKADVVADDEREAGRRLVLNFGHTIGHALEATTGFGPLAHGEAVVLGMRGAIAASVRAGRLAAPEADRALRLLARFPKPPRPARRPTRDALLAAAARDKKAVSGGPVRLVLLDGLGRGVVDPRPAAGLLEAAADAALAELP